MPRIREKYSPEILAKYAELGTCVKVGMEAWWLERKRLRVGIIEAIDKANATVTVVSKGMAIKLAPMDSIVFVKAPKGMKA